MNQRGVVMSAVQGLSSLSLHPSDHLHSGRKHAGRRAPVEVLQRESFLDRCGALTLAESADAHFDMNKEYQLSEKIKKLPQLLGERTFVVLDGDTPVIESLDRADLFTKLAYYSGYYQKNLAQSFIQLSTKRVFQAEEFLQGPAPTTLIGLRNTCVRVQRFAQEIKSMQEALVESQRLLDQSTNELGSLARCISKFAQALIYFVSMINVSNAVNFMNHCYVQLNGTDRDFAEPGILENLSRGRFQGKPRAHQYGIRIGNTWLMMKCNQQDNGKYDWINKLVGVYALPEAMHLYESKEFIFTGRVWFTLSEDGQKRLGQFNLERCWRRSNQIVEYFAEDTVNMEHHEERNLVNRRLYCGSVDDEVFGYAGRGPNGDQPVMRKLIQMLVEITHRENEETLQFSNAHDQAYAFTAAGFDSRFSQEFWEKINKARAAGKKFPDYKDERPFTMDLKKPKDGSILDTEVDFGEGKTTWRKIIEESPIFSGNGPILPRYWRKDLFQYEADE
jgi:hypothetical protein